MNFDYIPLDKEVIDSNVNEFMQCRKTVLAKIRFDKGFENSVVGLKFMNELMIWSDPHANIMIWSKVNIRNVVFNVAYDYLSGVIETMSDDDYKAVLEVVNRWSKEFKCAYDHSSSVNFSWAFNELMKEVKPLIK